QGAFDWNKSLFKKGIGKYLDGFSIHPYIPLPSEEELLPQKIRDLKEMVRQYSGKALPFFGTEQGSALRGNPEADLAQAQGMIRTNLIMLGEGFRFNFSFYIHDTGMDGYGYYYGLTPGSIPGTGKTGPKPIAPAYAAQTRLLEGHTSAGAIEWLGDTACGYAYERGNDVVLALWDFGGKPRQVTLPVGVQQVTLYDWMGNARPVATPDGTVTVTLTKAPIYLQGVAPLLWSKSAARPLTLTPARAIAFPGGKLTVTGTVRAPGGKPFTGTLRLEPDPRSGMFKQTMAMVIPAGKAVPFSCKLVVPATLRPGAFPVKVMLEAQGNAVAAAGLALQVRPPLAVERIAPQFLADGRQGLLVQVRDTQGVGNAGTVTAQITGVPETRKTVPFLLRPGGTQQLALTYADLDVSPFMTYQVAVAVETKGGYRFTQTAPINFFAALRRATAPKIDGDLADWDGVPALTLRGKEFVVRSPEFYTGPDDESVQLRYAWDAHALYLCYVVTDDRYLQAHTGSLIWQGDCLQLGFNLDADKALQTSGNNLADLAVQQRVSEIAFALTKDGPQAFRHATFNEDRYPAGLLPPAQLSLAVKRANGRLIYEAAIPWSTLGATSAPRAGSVIGVAATVNDMDDPAQSDPSALGLYQLKRQGSGATYPGGFGVLTLSGTVSK
ncbi:MAG TPA: sugar-binding protein, partial [Armatimonadota bacterium]